MNSCCCSIYVDDVCSEIWNIYPKANKKHLCGECGEDIVPGDNYEKASALFDGTIDVHKTCILCMRIRDDLCPCGFHYGNLREQILDCLGFDYITGEE